MKLKGTVLLYLEMPKNFPYHYEYHKTGNTSHLRLVVRHPEDNMDMRKREDPADGVADSVEVSWFSSTSDSSDDDGLSA